ncbi:hypothetical protein Anapl_17807 [Anas platyrhynchos]|uniref:Uncharacterized protein n=1 Tax=Anas platyrhynchos TaxID=8839 RepID=R0J762_ANAPL|nr:hypothetical protein Anapl_17807 [Anas platyrhynchos]
MAGTNFAVLRDVQQHSLGSLWQQPNLPSLISCKTARLEQGDVGNSQIVPSVFFPEHPRPESEHQTQTVPLRAAEDKTQQACQQTAFSLLSLGFTSQLSLRFQCRNLFAAPQGGKLKLCWRRSVPLEPLRLQVKAFWNADSSKLTCQGGEGTSANRARYYPILLQCCDSLLQLCSREAAFGTHTWLHRSAATATAAAAPALKDTQGVKLQGYRHTGNKRGKASPCHLNDHLFSD